MSYIFYIKAVGFLYISNNLVAGLECYSCMDTTLDAGSLKVASLWEFIVLHNDTTCQDPISNDLPMVECPTDDGYYYHCGYLHVKLRAWAHRVQEIDLTIISRDCMTGKKSWTGSCLTMDEEKLINALWDIVPHSVISLEPYGKGCFCTRDGCQDYIEPEEVYIGAKYCKSDEIKINGQCFDWYIPLVIALDLLILFLLALLLCCCCCPCCLIAKRRRRRRKILDEEGVSQAARVGTFWLPSFVYGWLKTQSGSTPSHTTVVTGSSYI